jgi:rhodanese-related sulfurtransferase
MAAEREVTPDLLRTLVPLEGMKADNILALSKKVTIQQMSPGRQLFKEGDKARKTIWVIAGLVELREGDRSVAMIRGGSPEARKPLGGNQIPRTMSARAVDQISYISVDTEVLDVMITWDKTGTYEVTDLRSMVGGDGSDDDWMTTLLSSNAFQRIPPASIQAIFLRMQRAAYRAGETIIKQGDEGDYFYAIVSGKCIVTRETPLNKDGIKLADLNPGDSFGEEALIAEAKRNATVRMATDGVLMRLEKKDFRELMNEPLVHYVDEKQAKELIAGGGRWLDVRLPSEFQTLCVEGSTNIPLYFIRLKLGTLTAGTPYVLCCDTGRRSAAAAFILVEKGFEAYVLQGGLNANNVHLPLRRSA